MDQLQALIVPLLWVVPFVLAVVNWVKAQWSTAPDWTYLPIAIVVAIVVSEAVTFFPVMPLAAQVAIVGVLIGGSAAGVWDIAKTFGTFHVSPPLK